MIKTKFGFIILALLFAFTTYANLTINKIFSSYMVLQQEHPITFFGTATPNKKVDVKFAGLKQIVLSNDKGFWQVTFPKMKATYKPKELVVKCENKTIKLKDLLIGEVWFCAGQSNMALFIGKKYIKNRSIFNAEEVLKNSNNPHIRYAYQRTNPSWTTQDAKFMWSSRWLKSKESKAYYFSALAYLFAQQLNRDLDVPVGVIVSAVGATKIQSWIPEDFLTSFEKENKIILANKNNLHSKVSDSFPSVLYNGMVASWTKLPIRGVIWYQGEANSKTEQSRYYHLHKALISSYRSKWNNKNMPFLIVQLAGYDKVNGAKYQEVDPNVFNGFAVIREMQQRMLELPNVGLATAIDIGEYDTIHPGNKLDVAIRLALEAKRIAYNWNITSRGPLVKKIIPENNQVRIVFDYAKNLHTIDKKNPNGFAVAGADGKFYWGQAKIEGNTVVVSSPKVLKPIHVKYAYVGYRGDLNLRNEANLPAYPFTSIPSKITP
jgi:sialate O-acetylesterase